MRKKAMYEAMMAKKKAAAGGAAVEEEKKDWKRLLWSLTKHQILPGQRKTV